MTKKSGGKKKSGMISVSETVSENRNARFEYTLSEFTEAGIALLGTEVKSLRLGQCSLKESYVGPHNGEIWIFNMNIAEYQQAPAGKQHQPKRPRKLLLHKKQVNKFLGAVQREGYTIVPTKLYFNARGMAKIEIALAKGKKLHDKRETIKKRDWNREKSRLLK